MSRTEHESQKRQKLVQIHQALNSDPVDIETLRRAAVSEGGLLTDEIRRKVWPKLLSINVYNLPAKPGETSARPDEPCALCTEFITRRQMLIQVFLLACCHLWCIFYSSDKLPSRLRTTAHWFVMQNLPEMSISIHLSIHPSSKRLSWSVSREGGPRQGAKLWFTLDGMPVHCRLYGLFINAC